MIRIKPYLLIAAIILVSGCSSISSLLPNERTEKLERVGILQILNCRQEEGCSRHQLLGPDMRARTLLSGKVPQELNGRLVAVLGLPQEQAATLERIRVSKTFAITEYDYQMFLPEAIAHHMEQNYRCISLWDRRYSWRLEGRQPIFLAVLSHPSAQKPRQLSLTYDGLNRSLISEQKDPIDLDPCQIN